MISDPIYQPAEPPTMSIPSEVANAPEAQGTPAIIPQQTQAEKLSLLNRSQQLDPVWGQRQRLPQAGMPARPQQLQGNATPPFLPTAQPQQHGFGGFGGYGQGQGWGGAPPWMQGGMGRMGGMGWGPPPWMQQQTLPWMQYQQPYMQQGPSPYQQQRPPPYMPPQAPPPAAPQYQPPRPQPAPQPTYQRPAPQAVAPPPPAAPSAQTPAQSYRVATPIIGRNLS